MRSGGYVVLAHYDSSSSDAVYEVRRGGEGTLYCTCRGWVMNLNNKSRPASTPAQCRHTKDYVAKHPGTSYGPKYAVASVPTIVKSVPASQASRRREVEQPKSAAVPAPVNWREVILREQREAQARGVRTPEVAAAAFAREISELDLDAPAAVGSPVPIVTASEIDLD